MANRWGKNPNSERLFWGAPKSLKMVTIALKLKDFCFLEKSYDQPRQHIKKQRHYFADKGPFIQCYGFSSSHICDVRIGPSRGWAPKNWCFRTLVLEKTPESPLDGKEIEPINPKGNQPWILIGRTDAEGEAPVIWSPDANSRLIGKVPDAGKDWGQKEKRVSENEMAGWYHHCSRSELGQTPGDGEGQRGRTACSPWESQRVGHNWETGKQQPHFSVDCVQFLSLYHHST